MIGELIKWGLGGYGKKPSALSYTPPNYSNVQSETTTGNLSVLPDALKLATATNTGNQAELKRMLGEAYAPYQKLIDTTGGNLQDWSEGKLGIEDIGSSLRDSAYGNLMGGMGGQAGQNRTLRDLGIKEFDAKRMAAGMSLPFLQGVKALEVPQAFDPTSMFFTPQQRASLGQQDEMTRLGVDKYNTNLEAMPDPTMAALGNMFIGEESNVGNMAGSMMGGASKGGGGSM